MVGCRNFTKSFYIGYIESIKHSDGGVSERQGLGELGVGRVYQAFRWWGVGTYLGGYRAEFLSLSSIPMVGCRNVVCNFKITPAESIKHSDGGVSELNAT